MADYVQYDPNDTIPNLVISHHLSASNYQSLPNVLANPDLTGLYDRATGTYTVPLKYWKVSAGSVVELTATEKDASYLTKRKDERGVEFESRSQARILLGHEFPQGSGQVFPLSDTSKTIVIALLIGKDMTTYPVEMNFLNNTGTLLLYANAGRLVKGQDADGGVDYRSVIADVGEAKISIEHAVQAGNSLPLAVTVTKKAILVSFATDATGNEIDPTAADLAAVVNADPAAGGLVVATATGTGLGLSKTTDEENLLGAIDVVRFYANAMGTAKAWLDGETALKKAVAAATTLVAVDAIVDTR